MAGEVLSAFEATAAGGDGAVVAFVILVIFVEWVDIRSRRGGVTCASSDEFRSAEGEVVGGVQRVISFEGHAGGKFGAEDCNELSFYDVVHALVESLDSVEEIRVVEVA